MEVDLGAVRHNAAVLKAFLGRSQPASPAALMAVVKADGYGHGMLPCARAARAGGADWIGVATIGEALQLRADGLTGPLMCWLPILGAAYDEAIAADVHVTALTIGQLQEIADAARRVGRPAMVQLKVDTGLSRGGASPDSWQALTAAARAAMDAGRIEVTGIFSHFATSDWPEHPANDAQQTAFAEALEVARAAGIEPPLRHLANSAATLLRPSSHYDLVRVGLAIYGLDPAPDERAAALVGLRPALRLTSTVSLVKRIPAGAGVSYGHRWVAPQSTNVGLVPVGYAEGIPRVAGDSAEVWVAGKRRPIRGVVCMDQFVIDLGDDEVQPGTEVVLIGDGSAGEPTAQEWADWCGTISYEIVTRLAGRWRRRYLDPPADVSGEQFIDEQRGDL